MLGVSRRRSIDGITGGSVQFMRITSGYCVKRKDLVCGTHFGRIETVQKIVNHIYDWRFFLVSRYNNLQKVSLCFHRNGQ